MKYKKKGKKEGKTKRWKNNMATKKGKEEEKKEIQSVMEKIEKRNKKGVK